jgi:phosphoribosylglycinamide formyltransferase 1
MRTYKLVVCASGGGGNFQALIDESQKKNGFHIESLVVDRDCGAIERAYIANIPVYRIRNSKEYLVNDLMKVFNKDINLIVLAGFMPIVPIDVCEKWKGKIINTHPSLLPKYGGKGMYGVKVQEAVMAAGERYAGCTVHYVNGDIDGGGIILQKSIEVNYEETPWELGGRIFIEENKLLVNAVNLLKLRNFQWDKYDME